MAQYGIQWDSNALSGVGQVSWIITAPPFKYLIKQNNQYYSIKPEFYNNGQFTPLILSGGDKPNDDDYNNQGFDDINNLCTKYNTENYMSSGEVLENGKLFTFDVSDNFKNVNSIE